MTKTELRHAGPERSFGLALGGVAEADVVEYAAEVNETPWLLLLTVGLMCCRSAPPQPRPIEPVQKQNSQQQPRAEPDTVCTPAGAEICGNRCGIVDAGCGEVLACQCGAGSSCNEGRCEARQAPPPPPRKDPPQRDETRKRKRAKPKGKCSCCHHHGGAYLSAEQHQQDQAAFRKCIADGGACESNCPIPP